MGGAHVIADDERSVVVKDLRYTRCTEWATGIIRSLKDEKNVWMEAVDPLWRQRHREEGATEDYGNGQVSDMR